MSGSKNNTTNIILVGVGGQGVLLVSTIIAEAAIRAGMDVKTNEVHGMAQRGGSVLAQVRFGETVYSPLVWEGTADILVALEEVEALRHAHFLKKGGLAVVSAQRIIPVTVSSGKAQYPADIEARLARAFSNLIVLDALKTAHEIGNAKAANIVTLGAASCGMSALESHWNGAIEQCVAEKHRELNKRAFKAGGEYSK
jgi:indolepyruvate ferredoxin oxidoreductase beta subunit